MPLQLEILTGGIRGRVLTFDQAEVRLGRDPSCDVTFDAYQDDSVGRSHACIYTTAGTCSVESLHENGTFLNGKLITGRQALNSGDVLRLARDGPEIRLTVWEPVASRLGNEPAPIAPSLKFKPLPVSHGAAQPLPQAASNAPLYYACGIVMAVVLMLVLMFFQFTDKDQAARDQRFGTSTKEPKAEGDSGFNSDGTAPKTRTTPAKPDNGGTASDQGSSKGTPSGEKSSTDWWQPIAQHNRTAVLALAAEGPNGIGIWSFGTACAVRDDLLVTTASVATQLESLRKDGWRILSLGQEQGVPEVVSELKVHVGYLRTEGEPKNQLFFDIAVLKVAGKLQHSAKIASPSELQQARVGDRVAAVGVIQRDDEDGKPEPIGRFDRLTPELFRGQIHRIESMGGPPGSPRMLLLPPEIPGRVWGSPVFNEAGKLIAVCTEITQQTPQGQMRLNYAPLVDAVSEYLQGRGTDLWVAPVVPEATPKQREN